MIKRPVKKHQNVQPVLGKNFKAAMFITVLSLGFSNTALASIPVVDAGVAGQLGSINSNVMQMSNYASQINSTESNGFNNLKQDMKDLQDILDGSDSGKEKSIKKSVENIYNDLKGESSGAKEAVKKDGIHKSEIAHSELLTATWLQTLTKDGKFGESQTNDIRNELKDALGDCSRFDLGGISKMFSGGKDSYLKISCEIKVSQLAVDRFVITNALKKLNDAEKDFKDVFKSKIGKEDTYKNSVDLGTALNYATVNMANEIQKYRNLRAQLNSRQMLVALNALHNGKQTGNGSSGSSSGSTSSGGAK